MTNKIDLTRVSLISAAALAAIMLIAPCTPSAAQGRSATSTDFSAQQQQDNKGKGTKAAPAARSAQPQRAAPQRAAAQRAAPQRAAPQRVAPQRIAPQRAVTQRAAPQRVAPQRTTPRTVTQPKITPRVVRQPRTTTRVVAPARSDRKVVSPTATPRIVTPRGTRAVTASRLRGVPARGIRSAVIRGHNYSAWRGGHRVRHRGGWRTFVALSALGAIAIGSSQYYPYAYISAPQSYCEGLTEDGCELMWQEVETVEGDVVNQCVAYCPWQ